MGIKGLPKLIQDVAGNTAVRTYKFSDFKEMAISVDASLLIHQTVIAMRSDGHDLKNKKGELTSHLQGIFYKVLMFLQNHNTPIFVFDGKAPKMKNKTLVMRSERKKTAAKKLEKLTDTTDEEYIKNFKQTFSPTKNNINEALILLDLMGIPYIIAPKEADVVCSWLAARRDANGKKYVKGVCSDDSDMLALGAPYLFKDMLKFMRKNNPIKVISLNKTLTSMKLSMNQFVDMCVLMGSDYCENIKGVGPKTAYKLISEKGSLEKVIKHLKKINKLDDSDETANNLECTINASNKFKNALAKIDASPNFVITSDQLELRCYQYDELMDFMCNKHNFDPERIHNGIMRLKKYHDQMNITKENNKKIHIINKKNGILPSYDFNKKIDIDFSDDDDATNDVSVTKDITDTNGVAECMPSKKTSCTTNLIKSNKIQSSS